MNPKSYFLVGPTASGKSKIAHQLALKNNHCIVSADSMNVYKRMNIGTAKPSIKSLNEVNYYGVNNVNITDEFSVMHWKKIVSDAWTNEKNIPITTGGTGLYLKCLLDGINSKENKNLKLREYLEALELKDLQQFVKKKDLNLYENLNLNDQQNPRRLIRAIEKIKFQKNWSKEKIPFVVGLYIERNVLHERIKNRVLKMFNNGLIKEAEKIKNVSLSQTALQAIGYKEVFEYLDKEITKDECIEKTIIRTRQLAKRQMTWFKNQMNVRWINVTNIFKVEDIVCKIEEEWKEIGPTKIKL